MAAELALDAEALTRAGMSPPRAIVAYVFSGFVADAIGRRGSCS